MRLAAADSTTAEPGAAVERLEIVRDDARLAEIGPAWMALWQRLDGRVFQSHAWVEAWWRTDPDKARRQLLIVLAWRGEALQAVLPLAISRRRGVAVLEWAAKDHTDYGDLLLAPGADPSVIGRLWTLVSSQGRFDLVYLNRLLPGAAARALFQPGSKDGLKLRPNHRKETSFRVAGAWTSGQAWFDAQSKKTRQNHRRGQKFIAEKGALSFRLLERDAPLEPVLERLAALKRKWLAGNALESALFDEGSPALAALVAVLARLGLLHVFVLECDGVIVAVSVNFVQAGVMMAFVTTYDPDFERGSPGMVLMMDYIGWAFDHGLTMVDFLSGDEPFKSRFATHSVTLDSVMGAGSFAGSMALLADRGQNWVRRLRQGSDRAEAAGEGVVESKSRRHGAGAALSTLPLV